jgi:hypothetical protein
MTGHHTRLYLLRVTFTPENSPLLYEIRINAHLDSRWADWFDGLTLTNEHDGTTAIRGVISDQAALHGVLQKVRDAALPLISVTQIDNPRSTQ